MVAVLLIVPPASLMVAVIINVWLLLGPTSPTNQVPVSGLYAPDVLPCDTNVTAPGK